MKNILNPHNAFRLYDIVSSHTDVHVRVEVLRTYAISTDGSFSITQIKRNL